MDTISTGDGTEPRYKDWGSGQPVVVYPGLPHGMCSTHKDQINVDLLAFIKS